MRNARFALLHDTLMAAVSFAAALYLRLGPSFHLYSSAYLVTGTAIFVLTALSSLLFFRTYQGLWRYASMQDVMTIAKAVTAAILLFYALMFVWMRLEGLPRSVPMIHWMVLLVLMGGPRVLYRKLRGGGANVFENIRSARRVPVLMIGANDTAELFLRETQRDPTAPYRVVGIVDDRSEHQGRKMLGITIFGGRQALPRIVEKLTLRGQRPQRLILADPSVQGTEVQKLLAQAERLGLGLARLPRITTLRTGMSDRLQVRPIAIEDLLGRPQTPHEPEAMRGLVEGKRVLVTGAGGTIGSELVRQIAGYGPAKLVLLDHAEYNLYQIERELGLACPVLARAAYLRDIRDRAAMEAVFAAEKPELVFHAAAIKHVPIAEENSEETVLTNVLGTQVVAEAALRHGALGMVLISTDKAVNPSSVMGATKRLAESYCQAMGKQGQTRFITVRFGNVLGSTGSVVPLFQKQLESGGPITVTHKDMVRYFMTVKEAVGLVLRAAGLGMESPEPPIYVLDMGEPVKIEEMALQMIRLAGLRPHLDIKIVYTGLRPGEKLSEELFHEGELLDATPLAGIQRARPREMALDTLLPKIEALMLAARGRNTGELRSLLHQLVPEFREPRVILAGSESHPSGT